MRRMSEPTGPDLLAAGLVPLAGGWSGETFLAEVAGERSVVRIYAARGRGPQAPDVDAAVLRLVRGLVPVPEVLEVRPGVDAAPGLLVTAWMPGERGDLLLPRLDDPDLASLGARVGRIAADLAGMPQLRAGELVDGELRVRAWDPDLPAYVDQCLAARPDWSAAELSALRDVAAAAQDRLDAMGRTCLVHGDLNPKNILVDPGTLEVTAVVDWEYAHAGLPTADLGNLLRWDRHPAWAEAVLGAWCDRHGVPTGTALDLARAADLWALVDLAARAGQHPVADRAAAHLRAVAAARDPHALAPSPRLDGPGTDA